MCWHHTSRKGAKLLSLNGNNQDAQWVSGSQCSLHFINRTTAIVTMPEWLAVKVGFMKPGALGFGVKDDKFRDTQPARQQPTADSGADE
jgi:hypothetical protein